MTAVSLLFFFCSFLFHGECSSPNSSILQLHFSHLKIFNVCRDIDALDKWYGSLEFEPSSGCDISLVSGLSFHTAPNMGLIWLNYCQNGRETRNNLIILRIAVMATKNTAVWYACTTLWILFTTHWYSSECFLRFWRQKICVPKMDSKSTFIKLRKINYFRLVESMTKINAGRTRIRTSNKS